MLNGPPCPVAPVPSIHDVCPNPKLNAKVMNPEDLHGVVSNPQNGP